MTSRLKHIVTIWLVFFVISLFGRFLRPDTASAQPVTKPDILFIAIDDLNTMINGYGGQAHTPNIDRILQEGMLFENAYTAAPVCNPSRISLLTGLRPSSSGITSLGEKHVSWRSYLEDPDNPASQHYGDGIGDIKTIFDHLGDNGYYIAGAGKIFHDNEQPLEEEWDDLRLWPFWPGIGWPYNMPLHGLDTYHASTTLDADWGAIEDAEDPQRPGTFYNETVLPDYRIGQDGLDILRTAPSDQPMMAAVGFLLPHLPWYVPQRILDRYPLQSIHLPAAAAADLDDIPPQGLQLVDQGGQYLDQKYIFDDEFQWKNAVRHYLASITYVDEQIGLLLQELETTGRADNTIIVVWGDHGFHIGEKSHLGKLTLWEEANAIPLIIKAPGVTKAGSRTNAAVGSVDLFPTLVELAGLPMPDDFHRDGRSLLPLLRDTDAHWPWVASSFLGYHNVPEIEQAMIGTRGWTYIRYNLNHPGQDPAEELYFRPLDPHQWRNLLSSSNGDPDTYRGVRLHLLSILHGQTLPDKPPSAHPQSVVVPGGLPSMITLSGHDPNHDYLLIRIEKLPQHGSLYLHANGSGHGDRISQLGQINSGEAGWRADVVYRPDPGTTSDQFVFSVSDGISSSMGSVKIDVAASGLSSYFPLLRQVN